MGKAALQPPRAFIAEKRRVRPSCSFTSSRSRVGQATYTVISLLLLLLIVPRPSIDMVRGSLCTPQPAKRSRRSLSLNRFDALDLTMTQDKEHEDSVSLLMDMGLGFDQAERALKVSYNPLLAGGLLADLQLSLLPSVGVQ